MNLERFEALVGKEKLEKIKNLNILIVGIGGVGGYVFESLVRSGVENITIIDYDKIDASNLNRQIITDTTNIGEVKVSVARERALKINPNINLVCICDKLTSENIREYVNDYDYIVDACDDVGAKVELIKYASSNKIKIYSCMGTAKKLDATKLMVSTLDKTSYCPLAKKLRKVLPKEVQRYVNVVYSEEEIIESEVLGSTSYVPGIAGLMITGEIIKDMLK